MIALPRQLRKSIAERENKQSTGHRVNGDLQKEQDILRCLDDGTLGGAEPLPLDSWFWTHPKVVLTPHNAADTDPDGISKYFVRQIERFEAVGALENVMDRERGIKGTRSKSHSAYWSCCQLKPACVIAQQ